MGSSRMTPSQIILTFAYTFALSLGIGLLVKGLATAVQRVSEWKQNHRLRAGHRVVATVVSKKYDGGPTAIRRVPRMTLECQLNGQLRRLEQDVPDDIYFHYNPGDQMDIILMKSMRFIPCMCVRGDRPATQQEIPP